MTKFAKTSFDAQMKLFREFQDFLGLKINYDKTEVLRLGALAGTDVQIYTRYPLHWSDGPIKVLGFNIFSQTEKIKNDGYNELLLKIETIVHTWAH